MITIAAEVEKHQAVEIFNPRQSWAFTESFTKLPAVPLWLCQQREQAHVFFYFYKIQSIVPTVNKGRFLKPYASGENWGPGLAAKSRNLEGWDRCLLAEGKKVGQSFQLL